MASFFLKLYNDITTQILYYQLDSATSFDKMAVQYNNVQTNDTRPVARGSAFCFHPSSLHITLISVVEMYGRLDLTTLACKSYLYLVSGIANNDMIPNSTR